MDARLDKKQLSDLKVLVKFIGVYCSAHHRQAIRHDPELPPDLGRQFRKPVPLCAECTALVSHSVLKRLKCPLDPKPTCKKCHIHCYSSEYRSRVREIMAYSGRRLMLRGRLDYLWHYFF
jgi:hypothetical protein